MSFLIGLLTVVMVFTCLLLILLVLIQLPKKEAGAGLAFGAGATDALFGAGSGNVLTKVTRYAIGVAFVLWMVLGGLQSHFYHREVTSLQENYGKPLSTSPSPSPLGNVSAPPAPAPAPAATPPAASNAFTLPLIPAPASSTAPASSPSK